jgi:hypothetical protein
MYTLLWTEGVAKNNKTKTQGTQGFKVKNLSDEKGKNHTGQPSNLHYMRECIHNTRVSQMQLIPCDGL